MSLCRQRSWNVLHSLTARSGSLFSPLQTRRRRPRSRSLEALEPRVVLAGDVLIAEVMSSNDETLKDEDGSTPDWLEIYNNGQQTVDLLGWHLTDQLNDRTKWTMPAAELEPGESIVVFASGKDRTDPAGELHTNFKIGDNEYLALFEPDGRTVSDEYNTLPDQYTDISYGVEQGVELRDFVAEGSEIAVLFPGSAGEDVPTATWTGADFDDAAWDTLNSGIGFDDDPTDGDFSSLINANGDASAMQGKTASAYLRSEFEIPGDVLPTYKSLDFTVNYDDAFVAFLNGQEIARVNGPDSLAWDSVATAEHGGIAEAIDYADFSSADSQDDFTLLGDAKWAGDVLRLTESVANQTSAAWLTNTVSFGPDYTFSASMTYDIHSPNGDFADADGIGAEGLVFVLQSNDNNVLGSAGGGLGLDNTGSTFLAIELDSNANGSFDEGIVLASHIGINTNVAGSVERKGIPRFNGNAIFPNNPGPGVNLISLWVDYSGETNQLDVYMSTDGAKPAEATISTSAINVAELFGGATELFAGWTSATSGATNAHDVLDWDIITGIGEIGRESESFDITAHLESLKTGTNVLAIQGLNINAADEDFLMVPRLTAEEVVAGERLYFTEPTPGAFNGDGGAPPAGDVIFSHNSQAFVDSFDVEITTESTTATIRYTLDGTLPDETSSLYGGAIKVDEPMRIRARAFEDNRSAGPVNTVGYIQLDNSLAKFENNEVFTSNLPLIVFDSFGDRAVDSDSNRLVPTVGLFIDPGEDGRASLLDEAEYAGRTGVRIRGQSSQGWAKKQYAVEIWEEETDDSERQYAYAVADRDVSIFGLPAESDWVLNGPYSDKTQLNNFLTFNWYRDLGLYAPRTRLVEVFVNADRDPSKLNFSRDYRGTYVLSEKIKVGDDRVDISDADSTATADDLAITGGYIWKKDKSGANDRPFRTSRNQELRMVEPGDKPRRAEDGPQYVTDAQKDWLKSHINEFEAALYGADFANPQTGYANYIDVDSWVETWLMVEMTKNIDGFRLSTYYHKDVGGKIKQGPAWDYNLSLGNGNYLNGANPEGWYHSGINQDQYPYWDRLFEDPNFEQAVSDRWNELRKDELSTEKLMADIDAAVQQLSDGNPRLANPAANEPSNPISRNYDRWTSGGYGLNRYHWPNCFFGQGGCPRSPLPRSMSSNGQPNSYDDYIYIMEWFLQNRVEWMDSQFPAPVEISPVGGVVEEGTLVTMTAPAKYEIAYTLDGTDPRQPVIVEDEISLLDSGKPVQFHVPSDGTLIDQCDDGNFLQTEDVCFINRAYTAGANGETWTDVTLPVGFDTQGDYDALVATDVEGQMLNKNASAYIRVPLDFDQATKDAADGYKLSVSYDDAFVAYVWWQSLKTPVELARSTNVPGVAKARPINALAYNESATETNPDELATNYIEYDISKIRSYLSTNSQNYLVFQVLNENVASDDFLFDAKVSAITSRVIVSPSVKTYEGPVSIGANTQIIARGFDSQRQEWTGATTANFLVDSPQIAVTELNYNPHAPTAGELQVNAELNNDDFEFVEIQNIGPEPVNLLGSYFDGFQFTFGDVELAAGGRGVIVKDQAAFQLRYGSDLPILGEFLGGGLSNNGERIQLLDAAGGTLVDLSYDNNSLWPESADGRGATLNLVNPAFTPGEDASKYYHWEGSTEFGGSPGSAGAAPIGVVINEVLANSNAPVPQSDSIELFNPTSEPINIGGWYLSDSVGESTKYRIPADTVIGAGGYVVFDESQFNANPEDPSSFALSSLNGDDVWLTIANEDGQIESFVDDVHFRSSLLGESFGRVPNGEGRLTPMQQLSLGAINGDPRVGPVVITEVNYAPAEPTAAALAIDPSLDSVDLEFIEIHNSALQSIDMTDWRVRGGIDFNFDPNETLASGETIVLTGFDPDNPGNALRLAAFRSHYGLNEQVRILGGYAQQLSGAGERITLLSTDISLINEPIQLPRVQEDEVVYDNQQPWPTQANGSGQSIHRKAVDAYGNGAASWFATGPSPGTVEFGDLPGDFNQDGQVNAADINLFFGALNSANPDLTYDLNGDGFVNNEDRNELIESVIGTSYGDANLDGLFDSGDLVIVFQIGEYEDQVDGNSTWAEGDWNGDREFSSGDLVLAFQRGTYAAAVPNAAAIVQPNLSPIISALEADVALAKRHEETMVTQRVKSTRLVESENVELVLEDFDFAARSFDERDRAFEGEATGHEAVDDDLLDLLTAE